MLLLGSCTLRRMNRAGTLLILASGACFGAMAIFGKLAYEEGVTIGTLLASRFVIASVMLWALLLIKRVAVRLSRRDLVIALALGAVGYAAQAGAYFLALDRVDASLLALLLYTYPVLVAAAAVALGRERLDVRRVAALLLASGGLAFMVLGAATGTLPPLGAVFGFAAGALYAVYILSSQGISARVRPEVLAAIVCSGAAVSLTAGSALIGDLRPGEVTAAGWGWLATLSAVSTVAAIALFFAGLKRVGPTAAAILSTAEPVMTVLLAFAVFGESLTPPQILGGLLVLMAVPVLHSRLPRARARRLELADARG
jgi:drug/metabolite transporter (DMT)-like permease